MPYVKKYKPKTLSEFVGQKEALEQFLRWIKRWKPGAKALLLHGPPGVGKTALVEAYAEENKLDLVQLNASDYRSASQIKEVLSSSVKQQSLFKRGKIFFIDEIDGLAGREDQGGVGEIIELIKQTRYPIILTANNPWDTNLRNLRQYCSMISFKKLPVWDIERRIRYVTEKENIKMDKELIRKLSKISSGDLRAALNDLETISEGKGEITNNDFEALGYRERESNIFEVMNFIFKSKTALAAKLAIGNSDKDPYEIFWWIENNIANEYEDPEEIAKAFDMLSKADVFKNRISSRQNWRFLAYMIDMMTAGVALSKREMYKKFTRYQYPDKIKVLGASKFERGKLRDVLEKLSRNFHCSAKKLKNDYLPFWKIILTNKNMRENFQNSLNLTKEELKILK